MVVSVAIREARLKKGWTQEKLARQMKVSTRTVKRWESGVFNKWFHIYYGRAMETKFKLRKGTLCPEGFAVGPM